MRFCNAFNHGQDSHISIRAMNLKGLCIEAQMWLHCSLQFLIVQIKFFFLKKKSSSTLANKIIS